MTNWRAIEMIRAVRQRLVVCYRIVGGEDGWRQHCGRWGYCRETSRLSMTHQYWRLHRSGSVGRIFGSDLTAETRGRKPLSTCPARLFIRTFPRHRQHRPCCDRNPRRQLWRWTRTSKDRHKQQGEQINIWMKIAKIIQWSVSDRLQSSVSFEQLT